MISPDLMVSLDNLLQVAASASATLRSRLESMSILPPPDQQRVLQQVQAAQSVIAGAGAADRSDASFPSIANAVSSAASQLMSAAQAVSESSIAQSLSTQLNDFRARLSAAGLGGMSWLTILGLGAGAVALYFIWQHYQKSKRLSSHEYPDPPAMNGQQFRRMGKALNLRGLGAGTKSMGNCRRGFGDNEKYEFEPEVRLEGYRRRKGVRR